MNHLQVVRMVAVFLQRTPITGAEAESMAVCKQWILATEQKLVAMENTPPTSPASKTGETKPLNRKK